MIYKMFLGWFFKAFRVCYVEKQICTLHFIWKLMFWVKSYRFVCASQFGSLYWNKYMIKNTFSALCSNALHAGGEETQSLFCQNALRWI